MQKLMALLAEAGDGDGGGGGAPAGGSPEGGQDNPPKDKDEFVPKTQFIAALNSAERKREAEVSGLQAKLVELEAQVKAKPAESKRLTRPQLNAAVAANEITQEQADAEIERQIREDAENRAHRVALETVSAVERKRLVDSDIARYKSVAPEILDETHETRQKIKEEFTALISLGDDPRDVATQLKAIRAVLGPIDRLERARSGRFPRESHQETGGGGGPGREKLKDGKLADQLNTDAKRYYEDGIKKGRYKDWAEVESELKYASSAVRQRLGIST